VQEAEEEQEQDNRQGNADEPKKTTTKHVNLQPLSGE
jgi:hypothetical protein